MYFNRLNGHHLSSLGVAVHHGCSTAKNLVVDDSQDSRWSKTKNIILRCQEWQAIEHKTLNSHRSQWSLFIMWIIIYFINLVWYWRRLSHDCAHPTETRASTLNKRYSRGYFFLGEELEVLWLLPLVFINKNIQNNSLKKTLQNSQHQRPPCLHSKVS